jgi:hypothetical protein
LSCRGRCARRRDDVAGMTDRFAFSQAVALRSWDPDKLAAEIDG